MHGVSYLPGMTSFCTWFCPRTFLVTLLKHSRIITILTYLHSGKTASHYVFLSGILQTDRRFLFAKIENVCRPNHLFHKSVSSFRNHKLVCKCSRSFLEQVCDAMIYIVMQ